MPHEITHKIHAWEIIRDITFWVQPTALVTFLVMWYFQVPLSIFGLSLGLSYLLLVLFVPVTGLVLCVYAHGQFKKLCSEWDSSIHDLGEACFKGLKERVWQLVEEEAADINKKNTSGETPLHLACLKGRVEIIKFLLNKGADVNAGYPCGNTPLHTVCFHRRAEIAKLLIEKGADINKEGLYGRTPLHLACGTGLKCVVEKLIIKGANINQADQFGMTPLHWACRKGHSGIAALLIQKGADINQADNEGVTPLQLAQKDKVLLNTIKAIETARCKKIIEALKKFLPDGPCSIVGKYIFEGVLTAREIGAVNSQKTKGTAIAPGVDATIDQQACRGAASDRKPCHFDDQAEKEQPRPKSPKQ